MTVAMRSGNQMTARGALAAGCDFFAGYPITPSSAIYAEMMRFLPSAVGTPDEITALNYAVGASLAGARAMTATSGPGWSLMVETAQYALMTETPVVIVVVQRLGPATGGATQGAQGDVLFVQYANSGGYPIPVLAPTDALDCYALTAEAFTWAERLRSPVIVLSDKETATTIESVDLSRLPKVEVPYRATASAGGGEFVPYGIDRVEDVPAFAPVGGAHKVTVTGSAHNDEGKLRKNDPETLRQLDHLRAKIESRASELERVRHQARENARTLLVSFGVSARTCRHVFRQRTDVALLELLSLFPVPQRALRAALDGIERVVIVEENATGLYARELRPHLPDVELRQVNKIGAMITPEEIEEALP